jgi:hypothetical protein
LSICKFCGAIDINLPATWKEWSCPLCDEAERILTCSGFYDKRLLQIPDHLIDSDIIIEQYEQKEHEQYIKMKF